MDGRRQDGRMTNPVVIMEIYQTYRTCLTQQSASTAEIRLITSSTPLIVLLVASLPREIYFARFYPLVKTGPRDCTKAGAVTRPASYQCSHTPDRRASLGYLQTLVTDQGQPASFLQETYLNKRSY